MDIIQKCEVTGISRDGARVTGVTTNRGDIACNKPGIVVAGHSGHLADMAGFPLPIESVALQALVSEPIKPCMDCVVMANTVHGCMSQSDKGEMVIGGGTDGYNNSTQRGSFHHIEETVRALVETFPMVARLKMLRQWGGIVDVTGDRSPILSKTPVDGIFINAGWGTGGMGMAFGPPRHIRDAITARHTAGHGETSHAPSSFQKYSQNNARPPGPSVHVMSTRLAKTGRRLDRGRVIAFTFNGKRPRGIVASGGEEPNALVGLGQGTRFEPNQRVTTTELFDGVTCTSRNHWPA
jgi:hypothetical protein